MLHGTIGMWRKWIKTGGFFKRYKYSYQKHIISVKRYPQSDLVFTRWSDRNQINDMIIDERHAFDTLNVKSCRGADCDSNHTFVKIMNRK